MIPKIIHYCWFGRGKMPELALKCIASWKKYLPDYEIKEWNEDNFDVNAISYTKEAYEEKKYAFVADYARFKILYDHGGLYFDTDVEVIRPMDEIIARGPFMGCECEITEATAGTVAPGLGLGVNPGLGLGVNPGLGLYAELLDLYASMHFKQSDGKLNMKTVVIYTTEVLNRHGLKQIAGIQQCAGVWIYPKEYFCPKDYKSQVTNITPNTYCIHHYVASWISPYTKFKLKVARMIGPQITDGIIWLKHLFVKH